MKKLIIIFVTLTLNLELSTFNCLAQPNGGFESWTNHFSYEDPNHWQTLNFLTLFSPPNPVSAFKATGVDKHSGNYALKLKTIYINNNPYSGILDDTIGFSFTGKINISPPAIMYGFPYTARPEKLEFWAKYIPVGGDTAGARIVLRNWNGTDHDTIAMGEMKITQTIAYTFFQINLIYSSTSLPDSAAIIFGPSKKRAQARVGSTLYIDDVALTGWVGINEPNNSGTEKVQLFPNPSKEEITIITHIEEADKVQIIDSSGRLAGIQKIQNYSTKINTTSFANGIYLYEICDKKNGILAKGKFTVAK